jgi:hypothetical protein
VKCGLDGGDACGAIFRYRHSGDFIAGGKVYASILGGLPRSGSKGSRIDAALLQIERWAKRKPRLGERGFGLG